MNPEYIKNSYNSTIKRHKLNIITEKDFNKHVSKEDIQMTKKANENMINIIFIRKMQIKVTIHNFTLTSMTIIKNEDNNIYFQNCEEIGAFVYCWWGCKMVQSLGKEL